MNIAQAISAAFATMLVCASSAQAQELRLLVPNSPASGLNSELARQLFPSAIIQNSTSRNFAANHSQLLKQSDAVLLTAESVQEFELENSKISNEYEQIRIVAIRPVVLWAGARTYERARAFASIQVAVPNDATGKEGKCADLLRKHGQSIQVQKYAKLPSAISDVKGGHLAAICAPYSDVKESDLRIVFSTLGFEAANGQRIDGFPGVPKAVLDGLTDVMAVYVPKSFDKAARDRVSQAIDKSTSMRGQGSDFGGWAVVR